MILIYSYLNFFFPQGIVSYEWSKTPSSPAVGDMQVETWIRNMLLVYSAILCFLNEMFLGNLLYNPMK